MARILTSLYPGGSVGPGLVHCEFRLVWEFSNRLHVFLRGKCLDARPVGTIPEFVKDTLRCNLSVARWLGVGEQPCVVCVLLVLLTRIVTRYWGIVTVTYIALSLDFWLWLQLGSSWY